MGKDNESDGGLGEVEIGVLEKASQLGEHSLSGAVVDPVALHELFPELDIGDLPLRGRVGKEAVYFLTEKKALRLPTPPTMRNHGNYLASICEIVRWLGEKAEGLGVNVFPGFRSMDCWSKPTVSSACVPRPPASAAKDGPARTTCRPWI